MIEATMKFHDFLQRAGTDNIVSSSRQILADLDTPLSCYVKLKHFYPSSPSFLLESVEAKDRLGRFSFIGFDPFLIFTSIEHRVGLHGLIEDGFDTPNPFLVLKDLVNKCRGLSFNGTSARWGGAVGYVGYDTVRFFEKLPDKSKRTLNIFDMHFIFPKKVIVFDNYTRRMTLLVFESVFRGEGSKQSKKKLEQALDELQDMVRSPLVYDHDSRSFVGTMKNNTTQEEFEEMVIRAKEYITEGDVIQVVLSQRFSLETNSDEISLYRALRVVNPSPYMFLLNYGDYSLIGSSPETLVKLENGEIEVRPIAGTKRRGKDRAEDELLARELLSDEKELAEHTMLVDLGRNDVGRVSKIGSVTLPEFMSVEKYSHVMHIVTTVKGKIRDGMDAFDVFQATFPAGTVSGAPKVRAMEIIEELETEKREHYAGCVGYFAYDGNMDFCITIRTFFKKDDIVYIQAGAGIVADSLPDKEYMETIHKSQALVKSIIELKEIIE
jgi:anthranilate synthase component 1